MPTITDLQNATAFLKARERADRVFVRMRRPCLLGRRRAGPRRVRAREGDSERFIIAAAHVNDGIERVVERRRGYWVIEKTVKPQKSSKTPTCALEAALSPPLAA